MSNDDIPPPAQSNVGGVTAGESFEHVDPLTGEVQQAIMLSINTDGPGTVLQWQVSPDG